VLAFSCVIPCYSDIITSASGMTDHQQVTTLLYCMVDNCTIMMVDSGEILDTIYTTDSLLVNGNQTSLAIAKDEAELWCVTTDKLPAMIVMNMIIMAIFLPYT